jgi:hypothetical protein
VNELGIGVFNLIEGSYLGFDCRGNRTEKPR